MNESRLKAIRMAKGLTQHEVAEATGIARSTIAAYEAGARKPHGENVKALAEFYGVSADYLLETNLSHIVEEPADAWRRIDSVVSPTTMDSLLRVWKVIQDDPEMQEFVIQLAEYDDDTIRKVLAALDAIATRRQS